MTPLRAQASIALAARTVAFTCGYGATGLALNWASCFVFDRVDDKYTPQQAFELNNAVLLVLTIVAALSFFASTLSAILLAGSTARRSRPMVCLGFGVATFALSNAAAALNGRLGFAALVFAAIACGLFASTLSARVTRKAS